MNETCLRCVAEVDIQKISWPYDEMREISLAGPPIMIKVALLGHTMTSPLYDPVFPVYFNYTFSFDRVFTNCSLPSLLPEIIRDETMTIELIQLKDDYTGGKILGRFESNTYSFLFPVTTCQCLTVNVSRHYTYSPRIYLKTSVTVTNGILRSPVSMLHSRTNTSKQDTTISSAASPDPKRAAKSPAKHVNFSNLSNDTTFVYNSPINGKMGATSTPNNKKNDDIIRKYLRSSDSPGSATLPSPVKYGGTPYERVTLKLDEVLEKYCDENNPKVEGMELEILSCSDDQIRESFDNEREELMNKTSQSIPNDSLLTRLGPEDYWSKQMAEHCNNGSHRTTFVETMEKIYNQLYKTSKE